LGVRLASAKGVDRSRKFNVWGSQRLLASVLFGPLKAVSADEQEGHHGRLLYQGGTLRLRLPSGVILREFIEEKSQRLVPGRAARFLLGLPGKGLPTMREITRLRWQMARFSVVLAPMLLLASCVIGESGEEAIADSGTRSAPPSMQLPPSPGEMTDAGMGEVEPEPQPSKDAGTGSGPSKDAGISPPVTKVLPGGWTAAFIGGAKDGGTASYVASTDTFILEATGPDDGFGFNTSKVDGKDSATFVFREVKEGKFRVSGKVNAPVAMGEKIYPQAPGFHLRRELTDNSPMVHFGYGFHEGVQFLTFARQDPPAPRLPVRGGAEIKEMWIGLEIDTATNTTRPVVSENGTDWRLIGKVFAAPLPGPDSQGRRYLGFAVPCGDGINAKKRGVLGGEYKKGTFTNVKFETL
jgi:hypothetical protein